MKCPEPCGDYKNSVRYCCTVSCRKQKNVLKWQDGLPVLKFPQFSLVTCVTISRWNTSWGHARTVPWFDRRGSEVHTATDSPAHHLLMFATGAAQVPVTSFDSVLSVHFVHDESKSVPSAWTCFNTLYLYVNETTIHNPIYRYLVAALMNGAIFSKI